MCVIHKVLRDNAAARAMPICVLPEPHGLCRIPQFLWLITLNLVQVFPSRSKTLVSILFSFLRLSRKTLILLLMYCAVYAPLAHLYRLIITDTAKSHTFTITVPSRLPATFNVLTVVCRSLWHLTPPNPNFKWQFLFRATPG